MSTGWYDSEKPGAFLSPNKVIFGRGVTGQIGKEARVLRGRKALIVTDQGVARAGLMGPVEEVLRAEKIRFGVYDRVEPEPPARIVDDAARVAREGRYDLIVGLGGGSSLDVAKGVSLMATNPGQILDYVGVNLFRRRGLPTILIPTTAGTGSEGTWVCVVTDEAENAKKSLYSNLLLPSLAVLDPMLTVSMPPTVTADTGCDALVHAIESYVSVNRTPFSELLALKAVSLIASSLPIAFSKGGDVRARFNMLLAAGFAGLAFTSGGLGATHGLAYPLGTEYHMTHGRANSIMLPYVMRFNRSASLERYAQIAQAMGEKIGGLGPYEAATKAIEAVEKLLSAINVSFRLSQYGVQEKDLPRLVEGAMKQARFFVPNPRDITEEDVAGIYRAAL